MTKLIPRDKLEEYLPRLLQGITNLYKRQTEHYLITQVRFELVFMYFFLHVTRLKITFKILLGKNSCGRKKYFLVF